MDNKGYGVQLKGTLVRPCPLTFVHFSTNKFKVPLVHFCFCTNSKKNNRQDY